MKTSSPQRRKRFILFSTIAVAGLFASGVLVFLFADLLSYSVALVERFLSSDGKLEAEGVAFVEGKLKVAIWTLGLVSCTPLILFLLREFFLALDKLNITDSSKAYVFFTEDKLYKQNNLSEYIFYLSTASAFLFHFYYLIAGYPNWEGLIEEIMSTFFLFSGLTLLFTAFRVNKSAFPAKMRRRVIFVILLLSIAFIYIYGEEISWGQRIFNWETNDFMKKYNYQKETNSHNFFNPLFDYLYPLVAISFFILLFIIWLFPSQNKMPVLVSLFLPHKSLFFLALIMACSTFEGHSETYEELLGIFVLLYSIRLYRCVHSPNKDFLFGE